MSKYPAVTNCSGSPKNELVIKSVNPDSFSSGSWHYEN